MKKAKTPKKPAVGYLKTAKGRAASASLKAYHAAKRAADEEKRAACIAAWKAECVAQNAKDAKDAQEGRERREAPGMPLDDGYVLLF